MREMAAMLEYRRWVLAGWESMATASLVVESRQRGKQKPAQEHQHTSVRAAFGHADPLPRPPGIPDNHPLVIGGTYR